MSEYELLILFVPQQFLLLGGGWVGRQVVYVLMSFAWQADEFAYVLVAICFLF